MKNRIKQIVREAVEEMANVGKQIPSYVNIKDESVDMVYDSLADVIANSIFHNDKTVEMLIKYFYLMNIKTPFQQKRYDRENSNDDLIDLDYDGLNEGHGGEWEKDSVNNGSQRKYWMSYGGQWKEKTYVAHLYYKFRDTGLVVDDVLFTIETMNKAMMRYNGIDVKGQLILVPNNNDTDIYYNNQQSLEISVTISPSLDYLVINNMAYNNKSRNDMPFATMLEPVDEETMNSMNKQMKDMSVRNFDVERLKDTANEKLKEMGLPDFDETEYFNK